VTYQGRSTLVFYEKKKFLLARVLHQLKQAETWFNPRGTQKCSLH